MNWKCVSVMVLCVMGLPALAMAEVTPCQLTWNPNTESDLKGYRIYKPGQITPLAQVPKTVTSYDCSGTADNVWHPFYVTAIDDAGSRTDTTRNPAGDNESLPSLTVQKMFAITSPVLSPPTGFMISGVTFTWAAVPGATGYALRVHEAGTPYEPCTSMAFCADVLGTSQPVALKPNTKYDVWLHSRNAQGLSVTTAGLSFTTPVIDIVKPASPTLTIQ